MTDFNIEYAADLGALEKLLLSVDRPGDFCTHGRVFAAMPSLEVESVGAMSFPVPDAQVRSLLDVAERAPYGKGTETLVDDSVRNCWQIDARRIRLGGTGWADTFPGILDSAATGLGCPEGKLDAQLYKLLVYEPGGFFVPHRDTEKSDGMVATLSVSLPAAGTGGELVVRHGDREATIDMNAGEPSELAFAAFYADCVHEVRPLLDGYRLSLVFNLCLRPGDSETPRQAPDYSQRVQAVADRLVAWRDDDEGSDKIVWLLEHDYSEAGLSLDALKNADASQARVMEQAADRANCELYAAIVHVEEQGEADYDGGYHGGWNRYGDDDNVEFGEVLEGTYWLDNWAGRDGGRPAFGAMRLNPGELLPAGALDGVPPDDEWVNEATGNAGVTVERAYRHAAIVIWPRRRMLNLLVNESISAAIAWVTEQFARDEPGAHNLIARLIDVWSGGRNGDRSSASTSNWSEDSDGDLAEVSKSDGSEDSDIGKLEDPVEDWAEDSSSDLQDDVAPDGIDESIDDWPDDPDSDWSAYPQRRHGSARTEMLRLLGRAGDPALALRFLREIVLARYDGSENDSLPAVLKVIGPDVAAEYLAELVRWRFRSKPESMLELLLSAGDSAGLGWRDGLADSVRTAVAELSGALAPRPASRETSWSSRPERKKFGSKLIRDLFALTSRCGLDQEADSAAQAIAAEPEAVDPERTVPAALEELSPNESFTASAACLILWRHAGDSLLARSAVPPKEPRDWAIAANLRCDCEHCLKLEAFCRDPVARVERFSLRQDLRAHLHRQIDSHRLDMSHVTERRGRPYTLVCTKNRASYQRRLKQYAEDVKRMRSLASLAPVGENADNVVEYLQNLKNAVSEAGADR